ncbi:MAG TPA: Ig-like domain-containing protein [Vicinamibacterales bacterium]|nr:Ig-like domain-containing protein [Vicinamibacterales bacterium]
MIRRTFRVLFLALILGTVVDAQTAVRRLTTIDAIRQYPGFYHLQNVLVRGEFATEGNRMLLRADTHEIRVVLDDGVSAPQGVVDTRGLFLDVGRLEAGDPRAGNFAAGRDTDSWPRPGEELILRVSATLETQPAAGASVRLLAVEPWRYDGQTVTVVGNFRGRNLYGDLPGAPGKSKYDFVLRGTEGAVWVTDVRPRGQGFDLDVNRRVDTDRWLEVTGTVVRERGLVSLKATRVSLSKPPQTAAVSDEPVVPPVPLDPVDVVFNSPAEGETDVRGGSPIRIQFSRGLNEKTLAGQIRVSYVGVEGTLDFKTAYDGANRAVVISFPKPLEAFRTVKVELLDGLQGFDGAPVKPWTLTFSVGG